MSPQSSGYLVFVPALGSSRIRARKFSLGWAACRYVQIADSGPLGVGSLVPDGREFSSGAIVSDLDRPPTDLDTCAVLTRFGLPRHGLIGHQDPLLDERVLG